MMKFSPREISDVKSFRKNKSSRGNSVSSGGGGGTDPTEEDVRKKTKKGIFGMFRKGSKDKRVATPGAEASAQDLSGSLTSPMKPIPPPIRRH
jgi:hypothetical protein